MTTTATTPTVDQLVAVGGSLWEKGPHRRVYFNNLAELAGLEVNRYNTGNVSSAILRGERLSNTRAREVLTQLDYGKLWFDLNESKFYFQIDSRRTYTGSELGNAIVQEIRRRIDELG